MKIKWKELIISLLIPLGVGALSAFLTRNSMDIYSNINQPPLAPPSILFPIVWTILFALMGVSSYLVSTGNSKNKREALALYGVQLAVNFIWPIIFFNMQAYFAAFIWLLFLWVLVILMIWQFHKAKPLAAYLQIPYIIWLTFAAYLNLAIYLLN
ncbi:MAG: tryptophan-rich sensory protein [Clostridia bacterium]|nr:tryptophan-rich sensory protein [Clostridia bacterium]